MSSADQIRFLIEEYGILSLNDIRSLISLCLNCHKRFDGKRLAIDPHSHRLFVSTEIENDQIYGVPELNNYGQLKGRKINIDGGHDVTPQLLEKKLRQFQRKERGQKYESSEEDYQKYRKKRHQDYGKRRAVEGEGEEEEEEEQQKRGRRQGKRTQPSRSEEKCPKKRKIIKLTEKALESHKKSLSNKKFHDPKLQFQPVRGDERFYDRISVLGDGNCFFHAIATHYPPLDHAYFRRLMTHELIENIDLYRDYLDETADQFVAHLSEQGTWIDHVGIVAMQNALIRSSFESNISFRIYHVPNQQWNYIGEGNARQLCFRYDGFHYDVLLPKQR